MKAIDTIKVTLVTSMYVVAITAIVSVCACAIFSDLFTYVVTSLGL